MIVVDTHVWIWWVDDHPRLKRSIRDQIDLESDVRISAISLLEITTAISLGRLTLRPSATAWFDIALTAEQICIEPLTAAICLESANLPGEFHRDPADRLTVALSRSLNAPLVTADRKILAYPSVTSTAAE